MEIDKDKPIYPISVAAKLLGVHPGTIRLYEEEGLVRPFREKTKRYYSQNNIEWIECLRYLIHKKGLSIPSIKKLLELAPCWEIKKCPPERRNRCNAYMGKIVPCWERATDACAKDISKCRECEVYIKAMQSINLPADDAGKKKEGIKILKIKREQLGGNESGINSRLQLTSPEN